jgi:hypothetical protein
MLKGMTIAGAFGIALGVLVVIWVKPDTSGGTGFIIAAALVVCVLIRSLLAGAWRIFAGSKAPPSDGGG